MWSIILVVDERSELNRVPQLFRLACAYQRNTRILGCNIDLKKTSKSSAHGADNICGNTEIIFLSSNPLVTSVLVVKCYFEPRSRTYTQLLASMITRKVNGEQSLSLCRVGRILSHTNIHLSPRGQMFRLSVLVGLLLEVLW